jgi:hypothetical protein
MGALALFIVAGGGVAYGANTVLSSDIVDGAVRSVDVGDNQVRSVDVRDDTLGGGGLTSADLAPGSVERADLAPSAFATGDIALQSNGYGIAADAVQGSEVSANALTGADVDERSLGLGSAYAERTDSVALTTSFQTVNSRSLTTTAAAQLSVVASARVGPDATLDGDYGAVCQVEVDGLFRSPDYIEDIDELDFATLSIAFGRTVFPGSHTVALRCRELSGANAFIGASGLTVVAVPLA